MVNKCAGWVYAAHRNQNIKHSLDVDVFWK